MSIPSASSKDWTGQTFGLWTVMGKADHDSSGRVRWRCRCACGAVHAVVGFNLKTGRSKGCQVCRNRDRENTGGGENRKDMTGQTFGSWTVQGETRTNASRELMWLCECSCGTRKFVRGGDLRNGRSTMCKSCAGRVRK